MKIVLNGAEREIDQGVTIATLLASLGVSGRRVAVERNLEIVRRTEYASTRLEEGDRIEVVHFVGGG